VCGGQTYSDKQHVFATLDRIHAKRPIELVIENGDAGVATFGWEWAIQRNVPVQTFHMGRHPEHPSAAEQDYEAVISSTKPNGCVAFPGGTMTNRLIQAVMQADLVIMQIKPLNTSLENEPRTPAGSTISG
jgi:hypothetical protein